MHVENKFSNFIENPFLKLFKVVTKQSHNTFFKVETWLRF